MSRQLAEREEVFAKFTKMCIGLSLAVQKSINALSMVN